MAKRLRKTNLRPIEDNIEGDSFEIDYDDINNTKEQETIPEGKIRVENNIDFFNTQENDPAFLSNQDTENAISDVSKYEQEIIDLKNENDVLRNENSILKVEKTNLQNEIETMRKKIELMSSDLQDQPNLKNIQDENDNLLLKNSELELELSKMRVQLRNNNNFGKPSPTQVYSREHYTVSNGNVINRKNGYQDWN